MMLEGVIRMADMTAGDVMVPTPHMDLLDIDAPYDELLHVIIGTGHSRFPVYEERDNIIGILLAKDLLKLQRSPGLSLRTLLRPAVFVPESQGLNDLLRDFRSNRNHLAIVIDEFGSTAGLMTIEDVLEEIVGEIEDEFDDKDGESGIYALADGGQRVAGDTPVSDGQQASSTSPCRPTSSTPSAASSPRSSAGCRGAASRLVGGLVFTVMLTPRRRRALVQGHPRRRRSTGLPDGAVTRRALLAAVVGIALLGGAPTVAFRPPRSGRCSCWRSRCSPGGWAAASPPRRPPRLGLRHGVALRRHLVDVRQHASLRRAVGRAGGAGGVRALRLSLPLPRRGDGGGGALAPPGGAAVGGDVRRRLAARRAGPGRDLHRLSLGGERLCARRFAVRRLRALGRRLRARGDRRRGGGGVRLQPARRRPRLARPRAAGGGDAWRSAPSPAASTSPGRAAASRYRCCRATSRRRRSSRAPRAPGAGLRRGRSCGRRAASW